MSLSQKDIIEYKTTLDSYRKNEIELNVIDDDFERDSLDGWSENQVSIQQLKSLNRKMNFNFRYKLILTSVIASILISSVILVILNSKDSNNKKSTKENKNIITKSTIISKDSIKTFQELPVKMQIEPSKLKNDFEEKGLFHTIESTESNSTFKEPIRLPLKSPERINTEKQKRENLAKETFLSNLKVIDYRFYRSRPNENIKNELGGTPADKERNQNESTYSETDFEYTYFSYLDRTLKYFNKNKYKIALNRFEVILETYPDDANALFYSSICLYNLNQFQLCENRLIQLQNSRFTNFDQEQQWYLLLVYKNLGEKNSFELLKNKIINENGFYSKSADLIDF